MGIAVQTWRMSRSDILKSQTLGSRLSKFLFPALKTKVLTINSSYRDGVYKLIVLVNSYGDFSNTGWPGKTVDGPNHISIENYHNGIHSRSPLTLINGIFVLTGVDYTGSDFGVEDLILGHMTEVPVSSFDPIFW